MIQVNLKCGFRTMMLKGSRLKWRCSQVEKAEILAGATAFFSDGALRTFTCQRLPRIFKTSSAYPSYSIAAFPTRQHVHSCMTESQNVLRSTSIFFYIAELYTLRYTSFMLL